jgi:hypothetical protein
MRRDIALFLVLVTVIGGGVIAAAIFLWGSGGGGGSSVCDQPLLPQGESVISQTDFQTEDAGLTVVIDAARAGNIQAVNDAYYANNSEIHSFTYDVDQSLREENEELAKELCEAVIELEEELLDAQPSTDVILVDAWRVRFLLRAAAEALGYERPVE